MILGGPPDLLGIADDKTGHGTTGPAFPEQNSRMGGIQRDGQGRPWRTRNRKYQAEERETIYLQVPSPRLHVPRLSQFQTSQTQIARAYIYISPLLLCLKISRGELWSLIFHVPGPECSGKSGIVWSLTRINWISVNRLVN